MTESYKNVIVFGPTGGVGRAVALEASKRGAQVWLAMRDTTKTIPDLPKEAEEKGSFHRIQADLTDPTSVKNAVQRSKADAAFFYLTHAVVAMSDAVNALKEGGVKYIVFLSSLNISPKVKLEDIPQSNTISWLHAQVELTLRKTGLPHTNLRPGSFAGNIWGQIVQETDPWVLHALESDFREDCIVPTDIGRVGGAVLVQRPSSEQVNNIYLIGPNFLTRQEQAELIEKVYGRRIERKLENSDQHLEYMTDRGTPKFLAEHLIHIYQNWSHDSRYPAEILESGQDNIRKYSGYHPTTYEEYLVSRKNE